jgi:hypothetical protein
VRVTHRQHVCATRCVSDSIVRRRSVLL